MNYEQDTISKDELNFFATEELVTIKPNFYFGVMNLVGGQFGPFRPNKLIDVPLWVAIDLRKRGKCYFEVPAIYSPESLAHLVRMEEEYKDTVSPLAQDFFQLFHILEENAGDQISDLKLAKSLVDELRQKRNIKIQKMMKELKPEEIGLISLKGFTNYEIHMFKNMIGGVLTKFKKVQDLEKFKKQKSTVNFQPQLRVQSGYLELT